MRLSREGYLRTHGKTELVSPESNGFTIAFSADGKMEMLFYTQEGNSQYQYTMHFTVKELRELFWRPLKGLTDSENELWRTLLNLWEKKVAESTKS